MFTPKPISSELSLQLKAFAILLVVFEHIAFLYGLPARYTNIIGTSGVHIFLILSGYGLYKSYRKKGISFKEYWNPKITKVFMPYATITILYNLLFTKCEITLLIKNIFCIDFTRSIDGTMWYMSFLLIWYMLFFIFFHFDTPNIFKISLLFLWGYFFKYASYNFLGNCAWQFMTNSFAFPFGVLLAYIDNKFPLFSHGSNLKKTGVLIVSMLAVFVGIKNHLTLSLGMIGIIVFFIAYILLSWLSTTSCLRPLLHIIGTNSYLLYLFEGKIIDVFKRLNLMPNIFIYIVLFVFASIICILCYHFFEALIQKDKLQ